MISFGSAVNSSSSCTSEDDEEPLDTISSFSASFQADSHPISERMPLSKHSLGEPYIRPRTPSSGVYPYVQHSITHGSYYSSKLTRLTSTMSDVSTASLTTPGTSLPSDLTTGTFSLAESESSAVTFANQALERSHLRRMSYASSCNDLFTLPSSLLCRPNSVASSACSVSHESSSDYSHKQSSTSRSSVSYLTSSVASSVLS